MVASMQQANVNKKRLERESGDNKILSLAVSVSDRVPPLRVPPKVEIKCHPDIYSWAIKFTLQQ